MNKFFSVAVLALFGFAFFGSDAFGQFDDRLVILETDLGFITVEFFSDDAPNHVKNFIGLAESGFYDGTIFHRIIPGFMIQGGDPNTIDGDPNTWGTGGPSERVDAEFNTIKHNRGIVSMARSADPDSGGSQFFIVHKNSNFLDEQYSVFGRIVTGESFDTLDRIAEVQTVDSDRPADPEQVKILKASVVNRSDVSNLLTLGAPERTGSSIAVPTGNQKFESEKHGISLSVPEGWLLQEPEKTQVDSPDVVAVGPKTGTMNPVISLTIQDTNERTMDELISEKNDSLKPVVESGKLQIYSQYETTLDENKAFVTHAEGHFSSKGENFNVKFQEVMIYDSNKFYILSYSNGVDEFDSELPGFQETIDSFEIHSKSQPMTQNDDQSGTEIGGCLIATATFGSELAPQVQQLRELRDNSVLSTSSGISFMTGFNQIYYSFSPYVADLERENPIFKEFVKLSITPMISTLSLLNLVDIDSEQEMISYGVGIILMNVGIYVAGPVFAINKIRKHI